MDSENAETIEKFLKSLEDFTPAIPDEVTNYYLQQTGFNCPDLRTKRVIALAAQKFISEIANDAMQHCKIRQQNPTVRDRSSSRTKDKRLVLTLEDLSSSLKEYGISLKKPDYFADKVTTSTSSSKATEKALLTATTPTTTTATTTQQLLQPITATTTPTAAPTPSSLSFPTTAATTTIAAVAAPSVTSPLNSPSLAKEVNKVMKASQAKAKTAAKTGRA